jgi:hypothetical protein
VAPPVAPGGVDPTKPSADKGSASYNATFADLQATLEALGHPKLDVEALGAQLTLEGYYPELLLGSAQAAPMAKGGISGFFWGADSFNPGKDQYFEKTSVLSLF